ncbi:hypothetical protein NP233_g4612 [Leucocoprinus birnbaumii]|uniref:Senescence domain-containing protein n=1 Tax=Leucocoprinus birnbaumii TaxID=56174 RepID=A0AAD5YSN4_9AGAR|nr:hypothetical protein NP233_g4612 [Leucocoprinus birnbaumii]
MISFITSPLVEIFRYALTPIAPFEWLGVPLSTLDIVAAFRLCIILRQLREMIHSKHVSTKGKAGVEDKSFGKVVATTLLVVYGGEAITAPFLGVSPSFMVSGSVPVLYAVIQAIVEYLPQVPELTGELELPLSLLDGFSRAYLVCNLIPPAVTQNQSAVIAASPWTLLLTSLITANGGFFLVNLFSILEPTSMAVQTPPELRAYGWTTTDLWCAPAITGLYAFMTHAQPFWADLHALLVQMLGGAAAGKAVEPVDPEVARAICAMILSGLFTTRTVVNFNMWKKPVQKRSVAVLNIYRLTTIPLLSLLLDLPAMQTSPEAFLLITLPDCTLQIKDFSETGPLGLQCVTIPHPDASSDSDRDVYLVLRLNMSETPIDPARIIQRKDTPVARIYTFYGTPAEPNDFVLTVPCQPGDAKSTFLHQDLETFEGILEQYAVEFRPASSASAQASAPAMPVPDHPPPTYETGEVVGEVEDRLHIQEDPVMYQRGHEHDPVVIEVPDEVGLREGDANALSAFARTVPPDQQDWITKTATVVSHAISLTTNLLVTTITTASNLYISKTNPSPHHSSANLTTSNAGSEKRSTSPIPGRSPSPNPPPLPPRALVFLTSDRTRKNLRSVHTISGQAVRVSAKTVQKIDGMIRRAMGARPKENRLGSFPSRPNSLTPVSYASSSIPSGQVPYAIYTPTLMFHAQHPVHLNLLRFPLARTLYYHHLTHNHLPQQTQQLNPFADPPIQPKLTTTHRLLISADLILSTIDDSARRILDSGTNNLGRVMHHKYGPEAAESSLLMAGTARNVGLVYIDMSGIGRRALLRRAGMSFVKGRMQSKEDGKRPVPPIPAQKA